jgi:DUF971 family protein
MEDVYPTEVNLKESAQTLQVTWDDGHVSVYPLAYLRGWCPCAVCQGHFQHELKYIEGKDARLTDVAPVGNYAMKLVWGDGHDTGIYSFDYLRKMCPSPRMDPDGARLKERVRVKAEWM